MIDLIIENTQITVWFAVKIAYLVLVLIYIIFSYIVVRQVRLMNDTLEVGFENVMKIASYIHFTISVLLFILAFFIL